MRTDVILIHGIGKSISPTYYDDFVNSIRRKLPIDMTLNFHPINYSEPLDTKERQIFEWMNGMSYQELRSFGCFFVGDVLAYAPPEGIPKEGDFYFDVNKLLEDTFKQINQESPDSKKVIISHSLGSQIAFSFSFRQPLDHLIVMGSPINYFSVRFKDFGSYPASLKGMTNFWNTNDPVATQVSRNPNLRLCRDIKVKSWNPRYLLPLQAHSFYWVSDKVHSEIADIIKNYNPSSLSR